MTVCIAACSHRDQTIVCATDMKVSMSDLSMSADAGFKLAYYGDNWVCMIAGDASPYKDVRRHFAEYVRKNGITSLKTAMSFQIEEGFTYGFQNETRRRAEAEILFPYGLTFDNYRDEGPKLGPETFSRILFDLQNKELGLKLMLTGFDPDSCHIFTIEKRGIPEHFEGFWAIGSGDLAALGSLFNSGVSVLSPADEIFYRVCCAKFAAETSPGVGKKTIITVLKRDGGRSAFTDDTINEIRNEWEARRSNPIPKNLADKVNSTLASVKPESTSQTSTDQQ